ncbi:MAG: MarR family transcriptional regulator [Acidobacteriota bacterium]|nr:MarR family transcriptional regulator [Acidobacteriota bacterium]
MPDAERDLVSGVIQLANLLNRRLGPIFERAKVTPQQWSILSMLAESEAPMTLAAIARKMMVSKQNMTGMMARLEQLGLAERHDDPKDLRSSRVQLTRRGRALVDKFRPAYQEWREQLGHDLPEREIAALTRTVDRLIAELEQA